MIRPPWDPDKREYPREEPIPGASVMFDGRAFPVRNWGVGGFLCVNYHGTRMVGDRIDVHLIAAPGDGPRVDFHLEAEVVRSELETQILAARFRKIKGASLAQLRAFFARTRAGQP